MGLKDYFGPERMKILEPAGLWPQPAPASLWQRLARRPLDEWFALKVGLTRTNSPMRRPSIAATRRRSGLVA